MGLNPLENALTGSGRDFVIFWSISDNFEPFLTPSVRVIFDENFDLRGNFDIWKSNRTGYIRIHYIHCMVNKKTSNCSTRITKEIGITSKTVLKISQQGFTDLTECIRTGIPWGLDSGLGQFIFLTLDRSMFGRQNLVW